MIHDINEMLENDLRILNKQVICKVFFIFNDDNP